MTNMFPDGPPYSGPEFDHPLQGHTVVKPKPVGKLKFDEGNTGLSSYYTANCVCGGKVTVRPMASTPKSFNTWERRVFLALMSHDGDKDCDLAYPKGPARFPVEVEVMSRNDGPPHWIERGFVPAVERFLNTYLEEQCEK